MGKPHSSCYLKYLTMGKICYEEILGLLFPLLIVVIKLGNLDVFFAASIRIKSFISYMLVSCQNCVRSYPSAEVYQPHENPDSFLSIWPATKMNLSMI